MLHHEAMNVRPAITVAICSIAVAACGSGDEATPTSLEVIPIPTTTSTTEPVFVPVDSAPDGELGEGGDGSGSTDGESTVESTTTSTTLVSETGDGSVPVSEPPSTDAPTSTTDPLDGGDFTLDVDGLGSTSFGADPEGTISFVSSFFGEPTADTGWVDPFTIGPCGGTELRQVDWNELRLEFGDVSAVRQDRPHFYAYTYGAEGSLGAVQPSGLATPLDITTGSSVNDLIEAYPTVELRSADEFIAANFFVNDNLSGRLSGLADDDVVELIIGGIPCVG